jgi:hypothetical protein
VEKSLIAFAPYNPRRASGFNLGALAIIMNFFTLVYNIQFFSFFAYILNTKIDGEKVPMVKSLFFKALQECAKEK